jgi:hypothetical protein
MDFFVDARSQLVNFYHFPSLQKDGIPFIARDPYDTARDWIGCGLHESFKKPTDGGRYHSACVTVAKATDHFYKQDEGSILKSEPFTDDIQKSSPFVGLVRGAIILDGPLLTAEVTNRGDLELAEVEMAPMQFSFKSSQYTRGDYRIDIVRLSALELYLDALEKQIGRIVDRIREAGGISHLTEQEIYEGARSSGVRGSPPAPL